MSAIRALRGALVSEPVAVSGSLPLLPWCRPCHPGPTATRRYALSAALTLTLLYALPPHIQWAVQNVIGIFVASVCSSGAWQCLPDNWNGALQNAPRACHLCPVLWTLS